MALEGKPFVIALEGNYDVPELVATFDGPEGRALEIRRRLDDRGELRLKEMDEADIDVQVISHGAPSTQRLDPETAVRLERPANDRPAQAVAAHLN
jgi:predicted TIM-barrel fold metal-dependent hydrolase